MAPTGTNEAFDMLYPDCVRNGRRAAQISLYLPCSHWTYNQRLDGLTTRTKSVAHLIEFIYGYNQLSYAQTSDEQ